MADVTIVSNAQDSHTYTGMRYLAWASASVGYLFFVDDDTPTGLKYKKTTDGGATWGSPVNVMTGVATGGYDIHPDWHTSGDSGTKIHIWAFSTGLDDVLYWTLETATDTLSSPVTVFTGVSAAVVRGSFVSGAKMRGGNLYCAFQLDAGGEFGFCRSTDAGANWTNRAALVEALNDQCYLFPGNAADANDCWALYHDASTDELTLKVHDDSADTNSESAVIATMVDNTDVSAGRYGFDGAIRHSDGHLIAAVVTERDTATADFRVFDINGTGSIVEKTAIATNIDDLYYPQVYITTAGHIYIAYVGKRDGSETLDTSAGVYYVLSTDGGATWSAGDTAYSAAVSDWRHAMCAPNGPKFYVAWIDISMALGIIGNADNAVDEASNTAPVVDAGPDDSILGVFEYTMQGVVTDDGLPLIPGVVTSLWSTISSPGGIPATFDNATDPESDVTLPAVGVWVLRLTSNDGELTAFDEVTITVVGNTPPIVDAGPDQILTFPDFVAVLAGSAIDDGLPLSPGTLSYQWSTVSSPFGLPALFDNPGSPTSGVQLTWDSGTFVLRLTVTDGELSSFDEMSITILPQILEHENFRIKINDIDRTDRLRMERLSIEYPLGGRGILECLIIDVEEDPTVAYRPQNNDKVQVWYETWLGDTMTSTRLVFTGRIIETQEEPLEAPNTGTGTRITAVDYQRALARRLFSGDYGQYSFLDTTPATPATTTLRFSAANSDMILTSGELGASINGRYSIELLDPNAPNIALSTYTGQTGEHIVILETDGGGAIVTTAEELKTLVNAGGFVYGIEHDTGSDGSGVITAKSKTILMGAEDPIYTLVTELQVATVSVANPSAVTTIYPHNLTTGDTVRLVDVEGASPSTVNGVDYTVTVTFSHGFTIPLNVTVEGVGGKILKMTRLSDIIADMFATLQNGNYDITMDSPPMAVGPWILPKKYTNVFIETAVAELMKESGWISRITPHKVWQVFEPGTYVSAVELSDANSNVIGGTSQRSTREHYITQLVITFGEEARSEREDIFIANGSDDEWTLRSAVLVKSYGLLFINGAYNFLGQFGVDANEWTLEAATRKIHHDDAGFGTVASGVEIKVPYTGEGKRTTTIFAPVTSPPTEIYEDVLDTDEATEGGAIVKGQAELDRRNFTARTLTVQTQSVFEMPGTALPLELLSRLVSGEWAILNTGITELGDTQRALFTYEVLEAGTLDTYLDFWRQRLALT